MYSKNSTERKILIKIIVVHNIFKNQIFQDYKKLFFKVILLNINYN